MEQRFTQDSTELFTDMWTDDVAAAILDLCGTSTILGLETRHCEDFVFNMKYFVCNQDKYKQWSN